jgi:glucan phosphorylase
MPDDMLIACSSMEIALDPQISTHSGGLGMLAGEQWHQSLRSFAHPEFPPHGQELEVPIIDGGVNTP